MREGKEKYSPKDARRFLIEKSDKPSEFEKSLQMKGDELIKKQNEIKILLEQQLKKSKSVASVDDILKIIYKEKNKDDLSKILSLFDNGKTALTQKLMDLISSAWKLCRFATGSCSPWTIRIRIAARPTLRRLWTCAWQILSGGCLCRRTN